MVQSCSIFFGSDDNFRQRHRCEFTVNLFYFLLGKAVMISECHYRKVYFKGFQIVYHLFGRRYSGKQQHVVTTQRGKFNRLISEDRLQRTVIQRGEKQILIGIKVHGFGENPELHGL